MDLGKRPASDASRDGRSMWRRLTGVGSSSSGGRGRRLPLVVFLEPAQPLDAAPAAAAETELERLRRYLEVSQAALEVAERDAGRPRPAGGCRQPSGR
jgi:hypothetical protein